jgi:protein-S-isoprenylcysteine O-methyltransferase Ste14
MKLTKKSAKGWDKILSIVILPFYIPYLVIPGLDAVRYQWSDVPGWVKIASFIVLTFSFLWVSWIMKENTYLSRFVEIQEDRGHKVITTGPYRFVRHPMYIGAGILMTVLPMALGSFYALIPTAFIIVYVIIRTYLEDKTLHNELEGYAEYAQKTKFRLIPGIW